MPTRCHLTAALSLAFAASTQASFVDVQNVTFRDYAAELRSKIIGSGDQNTYDDPTMQQRTDFRALANALWTASTDAQLSAIGQSAASLNYDAIKLTDNGTVYYGLREKLTGGIQTAGWGSYFVRQGDRRNAMVQVPHPLADTNTWDVGARAFANSQARGFLMAGAHRNSGGANNADVADPIGSIFQEVHEAWNGPNGENIAWQVHGFNFDTREDFWPAPTDAVLSNGTGGVSAQIIALDAAIEALQNNSGWKSYAYNTLDINNATNVLVNTSQNNVVIDGETFGGPQGLGLGGTTNVQQLYSTNVGGIFVHIELEQSFRTDDPNVGIPLAASAISTAISNTTPLVPEPAGLALLSLAGPLAHRRRGRGR